MCRLMAQIRLDVLELMGPGYLTDVLYGIMDRERTERVYRIYVTDALAAIAQQLGVTFKRRYTDIISPAPVEKRSGTEIAADVIQAMGLSFEEDLNGETADDHAR